jgi:sugar phosphate isomerase/epimerase
MIQSGIGVAVLGVAMLAPALHEGSLDHKGADKLGWRLALQSWTVQGTVDGAINYAKEIGLHHLEVFPGQKISDDGPGKFGPEMTDEQIKSVLDKAKAANIRIRSYGVTAIPGNEAEARKLFDWAKKVGIRTLVSEPEPKDLPAIDKLAGEYGMKVAIHDHPKPSRYWDPAYTYGLTKDLKNVGFCADVGHWKRSGIDPLAALEKYGDKVVSLHFKDLSKDGGDLHDVIWGTGGSQAAKMLEVLKAKGFKGIVAIEFEYKWDVATLRKCAEFFYDKANALAGN